jgi:hypothetical protein
MITETMTKPRRVGNRIGINMNTALVNGVMDEGIHGREHFDVT